MRLFGSAKLPAFIDRQTKAAARIFNFYWDHFDGRLHALEEEKASWQEATANVNRLALDRINEILGPAIASVQEMQERGFLIAHSVSEATLGETNVLTFAIEDEAERRLFSPSPFLALTRAATPADYAVARRVSWDAEAGELVCEVIAAFGDPGPHTDWVIAALAGSTLAEVKMLADTVAAKNTALAARDEAVDAAETASAAAILIAGGPVSSVNGKVGEVSLRAHEVLLQGGDGSVQDVVNDYAAFKNDVDGGTF